MNPGFLGKMCLVINKPVYVGIIYGNCYDNQHQIITTSCFEVTPEFNSVYTLIPTVRGIILSAVMKGLPEHSDSLWKRGPPILASGPYILPVAIGNYFSLTTDLENGISLHYNPQRKYIVYLLFGHSTSPPPPSHPHSAAAPPMPAMPPSPFEIIECTLDFVSIREDGDVVFEPDGTLIAEFVLMESMWWDSTVTDSYNKFTCLVQQDQRYACLDIASSKTLGGTIVNKDVYNGSTLIYDFDYLRSVTLQLETSIDVNSTRNTLFGSFGAQCWTNTSNNLTIGDGVVNAYDMSVLLWYQFESPPYDMLKSDPPSLIRTVRNRMDTAGRCRVQQQVELRREWQFKLLHDFCDGMQEEELSRSRRVLSAEDTAYYSSYYYDAPMSPMDITVHRWASVASFGRWEWIHIPDTHKSLELFVDGAMSIVPVYISTRTPPSFNCSTCKPSSMWEYERDEDVHLLFERHSEISPQTPKQHQGDDDCALVVSSMTSSSAMHYNTISLRQQPPDLACPFDLFMWVPEDAPHHSDSNKECKRGTLGVSQGTSSMNGKLGSIQYTTHCSLEYVIAYTEMKKIATSMRSTYQQEGEEEKTGASSYVIDDIMEVQRNKQNCPVYCYSEDNASLDAMAAQLVSRESQLSQCCTGQYCILNHSIQTHVCVPILASSSPNEGGGESMDTFEAILLVVLSIFGSLTMIALIVQLCPVLCEGEYNSVTRTENI